MAFGNLPKGNFEIMRDQAMGRPPEWLESDNLYNPVADAPEDADDSLDDPRFTPETMEATDPVAMMDENAEMEAGGMAPSMEDLAAANATSAVAATPAEALPDGMPEPVGFPTQTDPRQMDEHDLNDTLRGMLEMRQKQRTERAQLFQKKAEQFNKYGK